MSSAYVPGAFPRTNPVLLPKQPPPPTVVQRTPYPGAPAGTGNPNPTGRSAPPPPPVPGPPRTGPTPGTPSTQTTPSIPTTFGKSMLPSSLSPESGASTLNPNQGNWLGNLNTNPQVQAEEANFNANVAPQIENQMALSGLGQTSATANALARAQASMLPQVYQNVAQDTLQQEGLSTNAQEAQANMLMGLSGQQTNQLNSAIAQSINAGMSEQQIRQAYGDAAYNDFLRQQGLSEEATYGPFGQTIGSAFGSQVQQSK